MPGRSPTQRWAEVGEARRRALQRGAEAQGAHVMTAWSELVAECGGVSVMSGVDRGEGGG